MGGFDARLGIDPRKLSAPYACDRTAPGCNPADIATLERKQRHICFGSDEQLFD